jgi:HKD family nuclease
MGSANWGDSALHENDEVVLVLTSPTLAQVVDTEMDEILAGWKNVRAGDAISRVQMYFSPEDKLDRVVEKEIDAASERIFVAVFSLRLTGLADALVRAKQRGVDVQVITDRKQSTTTTVDEILKDAGITVVEALNDTTPFTAMHHKFMVVDGRTTLVGSYNWTYTATKSSYEDLSVIRNDAEVGAAFEGAFGRLWQRYALDLPNPVGAPMSVRARGYCDGTKYGDTLVLVGDQPELGNWDPQEGLWLSGTSWPTWTGELQLRSGARVEYKLVVLRKDGSVTWESGGNRSFVVPTDASEPTMELDDAFRY